MTEAFSEIQVEKSMSVTQRNNHIEPLSASVPESNTRSLSELTAPVGSQPRAGFLHIAALAGAFLCAGNQVEGQQTEAPPTAPGSKKEPPAAVLPQQGEANRPAGIGESATQAQPINPQKLASELTGKQGALAKELKEIQEQNDQLSKVLGNVVEPLRPNIEHRNVMLEIRNSLRVKVEIFEMELQGSQAEVEKLKDLLAKPMDASVERQEFERVWRNAARAETARIGALEKEAQSITAQTREIRKLVGLLPAGPDYESLSQMQRLQKEEAAVRAVMEAMPKTPDYERLQAACEKSLWSLKNLQNKKMPVPDDPKPPVHRDIPEPPVPELVRQTKVPMAEWTPGNLFDGKGNYRSMAYAKKGPYHLSHGDALQGLIIAVERLKSKHGGSIPAGYDIQVGKEVHGVVDSRKAIVSPTQVPRSVSSQSLTTFKNTCGPMALDIIASNGLPVVFSSSRQGLHFSIWHNPKQVDSGSSHWFVELVPRRR